MIHKPVVLLLALATLSGPAWAQELLRGPHPFLRDNELSVHGGYTLGIGDTFGGPKAALDYGYRIDGGLWLDLGLSLVAGICRPRVGEAGCARDGDQVEVLAGIKYKLRMNVPVVPYGKLQAGPAYLFPDESRSAFGFVLRGGIGAKYFPYDWIGVGPELTFGVGHAGYEADGPLARTLAGADLLLGAELQF